MYLGRMVGIGQTEDGLNLAAYRVSSRSFPERTAQIAEGGELVNIDCRNEFQGISNAFIQYTCAEVALNWVVVSNGSHTGPLAEKLRADASPREALSQVLLEFGFEDDGFNTPRIAGMVPQTGDRGWLGVISERGLDIQEILLKPGIIRYVSTNAHWEIKPDYEVICSQKEASEIARALIDSYEWSKFEHPVTSVACVSQSKGFRIETYTFK